MHWIGELWAKRAITVADEHVATTISEGVLAAVKPRTAGPPLAVGETVLLAAPEGEMHGLGLKMSADVLEAAGFRVIHLGVDVPMDALTQVVAAYAPAITGLSLTMPRSPAQVRELVDTVTAAHPRTRVMVGGQGVPEWLTDAEISYMHSVEALVAGAERILTTPSPAGERAPAAGPGLPSRPSRPSPPSGKPSRRGG
jgi:methanogenic corrinoid protein MtbC1